jgi:two-component system, NtrC family, nitrogen regulation response regulator GlnG
VADLTQPTQSITAQELPLEAVRLEAVEGPGKGAGVTLRRGSVVVGSSSRADLRLEDPAVSRQHASFELVRGAVRVRDLGSRNGLRALGARVEVATLPIGTRVTLGRTVVRIAPLDSPDGARLSARTELFELVARSPAMRRLLWRLERAAATDASVVIWGPTGAGKELVARALHRLSARGSHPLELFDCAAARGELIESELFGHVRGAFTGATGDRAGLVELAHRGTLVLDNLDQLPLELQTRLLRLLEERRVRRLGASRGRPVDLRILATMQVAPDDAVAAGRLRSDLFFRVAEVILEVPSLAQRKDDIAPLAGAFAAQLGGLAVTLSEATLAALEAHTWPGNVRELKNAVSRCLAFGGVEAGPDPSEPAAPAASAVDLKGARARVVGTFEADFLRALLQRHRWNVAAAARDAKVARSHLYALIARHGLKRT